MKSVWIVRDMDRVDTGDEAEGHVAAIFAEMRDALETRVRLEARRHPSHELGYRYHFEIERLVVHGSALTYSDIERGCADVLAPPRSAAS